MSRPLLLLRPQPGNDASADRAEALGIEVVQLPLFEIVPLHNGPAPDGPFDALLVTSPNGARYGVETIARFADLPIYTVGETSAQAVRAHGGGDVRMGGGDVRMGGGDAARTIPMIVADGVKIVLHICGEEVRPFDSLGLTITQHIVYGSDARDMRPFTKMLVTMPPSVIAIHSPAAGRRLNALMPPSCRNHMVLGLSEAAADAAGKGWRKVHVSPTPDDSALLRIASTLCIGPS